MTLNLVSWKMLIVGSVWVLLSVLEIAGSLVNFVEDSSPELAYTIHLSLVDLFLEPRTHVNIISSVNESHNDQLVDFIANLIQNASMASSITFALNSHDDRSRINLIIVDSYESFENISSFVTIKRLFVIVMVRGRTFDIQKVYRVCLKKKVLDVFVMFKERGKIIVTTYDPFTAIDCQSTTPRVITGKQLKIPRELSSFHRCPLTFGININPPYTICNNVSCNIGDLRGRDAVLLKTLSTALNFSIQSESFGIQWVKRVISSLGKGQTDAIIGDFFLRRDRTEVVDSSIPYFDSYLSFLVPRGRPYTSLESLLKPFQPVVWTLLAILILIAVLVITIIKLQSMAIRQFVLGINSPTMSLLSVICGVALSRLPTRNFARFLLMCFIMFCLVMRTLYQGSVYKFLQSRMRHKLVETIDDIVREDFKFYIHELSVDVLVDGRIKNSSVRPIAAAQLDDIVERLNDPSFKGVLLRSRPISLFELHANGTKRKYEISKEVFVRTPVVMYFQKGSFLTATFNAKLYQLMYGGLIEYWDNEFPRKGRKKIVLPKILTMSHLIGIFQIWCLGCLLATMAFMMEYFKVSTNRC